MWRHQQRWDACPAEQSYSGGDMLLREVSTLQDEVAVKMVSRGVSNAKAAEREIANLRLCALHPYIIHMREARLVAYLVWLTDGLPPLVALLTDKNDSAGFCDE